MVCNQLHENRKAILAQYLFQVGIISRNSAIVTLCFSAEQSCCRSVTNKRQLQKKFFQSKIYEKYDRRVLV